MGGIGRGIGGLGGNGFGRSGGSVGLGAPCSIGSGRDIRFIFVIHFLWRGHIIPFNGAFALPKKIVPDHKVIKSRLFVWSRLQRTLKIQPSLSKFVKFRIE